MKEMPFAEMADSFFSFGALTRVWISLADAVPKNLAGDLIKVRRFMMDPANNASTEVSLTGQITIYRGQPQVDSDTERSYIPMSVVAMEEYGYAKSLDTTIQMTADFNKPNFGVTRQLTSSLDVPAEARMLMTLKFSGVSGRMAEMLNAAQPTVAKVIQATINSFPFTDASAIFHHVGDSAREIKSHDGRLVGYLGDGVMVPQYQARVPSDLTRDLPTLASQHTNILQTVSKAERDFLMGRTSNV